MLCHSDSFHKTNEYFDVLTWHAFLRHLVNEMIFHSFHKNYDFFLCSDLTCLSKTPCRWNDLSQEYLISWCSNLICLFNWVPICSMQKWHNWLVWFFKSGNFENEWLQTSQEKESWSLFICLSKSDLRKYVFVHWLQVKLLEWVSLPMQWSLFSCVSKCSLSTKYWLHWNCLFWSASISSPISSI